MIARRGRVVPDGAPDPVVVEQAGATARIDQALTITMVGMRTHASNRAVMDVLLDIYRALCAPLTPGPVGTEETTPVRDHGRGVV